jgi:hypothetical protein
MTSLVAKLKGLKQNYRNECQGFRERKYAILAEALGIAVDLRSNGRARKAFRELSGAKPNGKDSIGSLTAAVVVFVMNAKSESQLKQAWKYARKSRLPSR